MEIIETLNHDIFVNGHLISEGTKFETIVNDTTDEQEDSLDENS